MAVYIPVKTKDSRHNVSVLGRLYGNDNPLLYVIIINPFNIILLYTAIVFSLSFAGSEKVSPNTSDCCKFLPNYYRTCAYSHDLFSVL